MPYTKDHLDSLRTTGQFGEASGNPIVATPGAAEIIDGNIQGLMFEFMTFDQWDNGWDAHDLHEMGLINFDGKDIIFKIDPLDTAADTYVLTFMTRSDL